MGRCHTKERGGFALGARRVYNAIYMLALVKADPIWQMFTLMHGVVPAHATDQMSRRESDKTPSSLDHGNRACHTMPTPIAPATFANHCQELACCAMYGTVMNDMVKLGVFCR